MHSKAISDKARNIVATVLLDNEVSQMLKKLKDKSIITYEHCLNVAFIVAQILVSKNIAEEEIFNITEGSLLHDIGKLDIPTWLLEKRDTLSSDEQKEIRRHPKYGLKLLSSEFTKKRSKVVQDMVYMHHERDNGSGYPKGLKGKDISWYCRLLSTVDAFDALTAERSYGKAYSFDEAINILTEENYPLCCIDEIVNTEIR